MPDLLARNLSDEVLEKLKQRARANHRSVAGELRAIVEQAVLGETVSSKVTPEQQECLDSLLAANNPAVDWKFNRDELYDRE